jgi:hypothetical protein
MSPEKTELLSKLQKLYLSQLLLGIAFTYITLVSFALYTAELTTHICPGIRQI